jgi:hypothetical protein
MLLALILVQNWVCYDDFSIEVIFLVGAFLGVGRTPVATSSPRLNIRHVNPAVSAKYINFII